MNTITKAKNDGLNTSADGTKITLDNVESLPFRKTNGSKFKKEYSNVVDNVEAIVQKPMFTRNQKKGRSFITVGRDSKF